MDNHKGIAIVLAMFAALLVMLAGKSCTDNMNNKNNKKSNSAPTGGSFSVTAQNNTLNQQNGVNEYTITGSSEVTTESIEYITDILGRVVGTVAQSSTEPTEATTEPQVEYVTDILGRVVSIIEPETVITTEDPTAVTEYKNPLEEYLEEHPNPTVSGKDKDIDGEHYTVPSSLYITIG